MSDSEINKRFLDLSFEIVGANLDILKDLLDRRRVIYEIAEKTQNEELKAEAQKLSKNIEKLLARTDDFTEKRKELFIR